MKTFSKFALALVCAMFLFATLDAQAQKKPKVKLSKEAKEIVGAWILDDFSIKLDESKADDAQKEQFAMMSGMMGSLKGKMKGKMSFDFKSDGTYKFVNQEKGDGERTGTWSREGNKLSLKPNDPEDKTPPTFVISMAGGFLTMEAPTKPNDPTIVVMKMAKSK